MKIEEINNFLSKNIKECQIQALKLPMKLENIKFIISNTNNGNTALFLCWLEILLKNPFEIKKFLNFEDQKKLLEFLIFNTKNTEEYKKLAIKNLSLIAMNLGHSNIYKSENGKFFIFDFEVSKIIYYTFLKDLSKISKVEYEDLSSKDSEIIKKLKLKIIKFQTLKKFMKIKKCLEVYISNLKETNTNVSWTLCKCFVKIIKLLEQPQILEIIESMKFKIGKIFANENMWINTFIIFSLLNLNYIQIQNIEDKLILMLEYDEEYVHQSSLIRECALFMIWSYIRTEGSISLNLLYHVISTSLSDSNLSCRRAASTVLLEYIGRGKISYGDEITETINFQSVRRLENSIFYYKKLNYLPEFKKFFEIKVFKKVFHYKPEVRNCSSLCYIDFILEKGCICSINIVPSCNNEIIGVFLLIKEFLLAKDICKACKESEKSLIGFFKSLEVSEILNLKLENEFLEILNLFFARQISYKNLHKNIILLLDKNVLPEKIYNTVNIMCCSDNSNDKVGAMYFNTENCNNLPIDESQQQKSYFLKSLFEGLLKKNNEAFILVNSLNFNYKEKVIQKLISNMKSPYQEKKLASLKSLISIAQKEEYKKYIIEGLEDYSVDYRGDVGVKMRQSCLIFSKEIDTELFTKYFIRFFVDKSKGLRDYVLYLAIEAYKEEIQAPEYPILNKNFSFPNLPSTLFPKKEDFSSIHLFLKSYFSSFSSLLDSLSPEKAHFESSFLNIHFLKEEYFEQFLIGILCTLKNSDASLFHYILDKCFTHREVILPYIYKFTSQEIYKNVRSNRLIVLSLIFIDQIILKEKESNIFIFFKNEILYKNIEQVSLDFKSERVAALCSDIFDKQ